LIEAIEASDDLSILVPTQQEVRREDPRQRGACFTAGNDHGRSGHCVRRSDGSAIS
jgi:hypothetical protein